MKVFKYTAAFAIMALLASCAADDDYSAPTESACTTLTPTKTVAEVTTGITNEEAQYIGDDIIEAYVTSSDEGGVFYKSISMVSTDGAIGFSVPVDAYNLYTKYEPGRKVYIRMKDLYLVNSDQYDIGIQIGGLYNGNTPADPTDDEVGRLSGVTYQNILIKSCNKVNEDELVNRVTITELLNDSYLNKLVELDNVQFNDASQGKKYYDPSLNDLGGATNHLLQDVYNNTVIFRLSSFAVFNQKLVPAGSGKIRGVLTKYNGDYQLIPRTESDIKLDQPRIAVDLAAPIVGTDLQFRSNFVENFTSYPTTPTASSRIFAPYINDPFVGSRYWETKTFSGNKYIQMTSFGGTPEVNRTLFYVPVDFGGASNLSFKTKAGFDNGAKLKVYYLRAEDYTAGQPLDESKLVEITTSFTISAGQTSGYPTNFTNSGVYAIPGTLTGNGYFVFEYSGDGTSNLTTTMQIDDITVN